MRTLAGANCVSHFLCLPSCCLGLPMPNFPELGCRDASLYQCLVCLTTKLTTLAKQLQNCRDIPPDGTIGGRPRKPMFAFNQRTTLRVLESVKVRYR